MVRIDIPLLKKLDIAFNQIVFDTPLLVQFISRTSASKAPEAARVIFKDRAAMIDLSSRASDYEDLSVEILCKNSDWQVPSLEQVCTWC